MSLPVAMRLRKPSEFQQVLKRGRRSGDSILLMSALRTDMPNRRIGLAVSKRVGGAVIRNKVKRRLKEVFRELEKSVDGGWDVVISARPAAAEAEFEDLRASTFKLADRLRVREISDN